MQQCIHAPRTSHMSRSGRMPQHGDDSPWKVLLKVLQALHEQLESNEVPKFLRRKLFLQLFSFINVQLFNQLLLRRECCSFANGEYVKQGLGQVRVLNRWNHLSCRAAHHFAGEQSLSYTQACSMKSLSAFPNYHISADAIS